MPWQRTSGHREEESQPEGEAAEGEDDWIPVRWPEEEDKSKEGRLEKTSAAMDGLKCLSLEDGMVAALHSCAGTESAAELLGRSLEASKWQS